MLGIFLFSSLPANRLPTFPGLLEVALKKGGHLLAYALLAWSFQRGLGAQTAGERWFAWLLAVAYAFSDELHQSFVPGRGAALLDVAIDALGAAIGLLPWFRR
jgi:VanZ family protein